MRKRKWFAMIGGVAFVMLFFTSLSQGTTLEPNRPGAIKSEDANWEGLSSEPGSDPLESINRVFFSFNDTLYFWLLKPAATVFDTFIPSDVRISIRNALHNITAPIRVVNNLLQGKVKNTGTELSRFVINSTVGILGLGDPASTEFGIVEKNEDFGQTLGSYGIGAGPYICWPLLGPSNLRDTLGTAVDALLNPFSFFGEEGYTSAGFSLGKRINHISLNLQEYDDFKDAAIDPYVSLRDAYRQYRVSQIEDKGAEAGTVPYSGAE